MSSVTTFQLHRASLALIAVLSLLVCALFFTAGLSVGIAWRLPAVTNVTADDTLSTRPSDVPEPTREIGSTTPVPEASVATPSATGPAASGASVPGASVSGPSMTGPSASGPSMSGPSMTEPSVSGTGLRGPTVQGPRVDGPSLRRPTVGSPRVSGPSLRPTSSNLSAAAAAWPADDPPAAAATDPASSATAPAPTAAQTFAIQLGAFLFDENTQTLVEDLQRRGLEPFIVRMPTAEEQVLQSVRIGPYSTRSEALRTAQTLRSTQGLDGFVVRSSPRLD
ncbi:MAG: SPOR domain-containing protein [Acidobacteriota bacterium]